MAETINLGGGSSSGPGAPKPKSQTPNGLRREAPRGVVIAAAVLLAGCLFAGGWYAWNGGWKTKAQKEWEYRHVYGPIHQAQKGMMDAFNAENARRKADGEPLLKMPPDRHQSFQDAKAKLAEMRQKYGSKAGPPAQNP
ncbi:MAG: hypothetical protein KGJ62_09860 [Armatimonadetes bacterium]|nr:hypothetical protein [Armatimonadota bacterium]